MLRPWSLRSAVGAGDTRRPGDGSRWQGRAAACAGAGGVGARADAPAVIAAILDALDHLPEVLPDVAGPELAGLAVEAELPDVAQADAVDLGGPVGMGLRPPRRVVGGNPGRLAAGRMIDVDPQDRAAPVLRVLTGRERVGGGPAIAQGDVEIAVGPEDDRAPVVVLERILLRDPWGQNELL